MASKILTSYLPEIIALGGTRSKPSMVTVNLTSRCNQRCIYCEIGATPAPAGKDALTVGDLKWIIDEMAVNGIRKISLCGGEPFLFKGLTEVIAYAGEKGIRCSVTTNGMTAHMLEEEELEILKKCKTGVNVSVDSFDEGIQALTRGTPAALPNALRSILILSEKSIPVTVLTVISKYNFDGLFNFLVSAYEKGIKQVLFQPVICHSNYPDQPAVENKPRLNVPAERLDDLMDELGKILKFERMHKIKTNVYRIYPWIRQYLETASASDGKWFFQEVVKKFYCREVDAIIDISFDGGIQPCGLAPASVFITGNRDRGLLAMWAEATGQIREDLLNNRYYEFCNGCCHHFSRNMIASVIRHPVKNRAALIRMVPLVISRLQWRLIKRML
jgi:MoaA/NifB/PqqE/SkfB family radical SAM enzyme